MDGLCQALAYGVPPADDCALLRQAASLAHPAACCPDHDDAMCVPKNLHVVLAHSVEVEASGEMHLAGLNLDLHRPSAVQMCQLVPTIRAEKPARHADLPWQPAQHGAEAAG